MKAYQFYEVFFALVSLPVWTSLPWVFPLLSIPQVGLNRRDLAILCLPLILFVD